MLLRNGTIDSVLTFCELLWTSVARVPAMCRGRVRAIPVSGVGADPEPARDRARGPRAPVSPVTVDLDTSGWCQGGHLATKI